MEIPSLVSWITFLPLGTGLLLVLLWAVSRMLGGEGLPASLWRAIAFASAASKPRCW